MLYRRVFIPDTHTPDHSVAAVRVAMNIIKDFKPHEVVYLGDWFDCYSVSAHDKNPYKVFESLKDELKPGIRLMKKIDALTKGAKQVFIMGNHEDRVARYLARNASKLMSVVNTRKLFEIPDHYIVIRYGLGGYYKCGTRLVATHGSLAGEHPALSHLRKYKTSVITGHTHKLQKHMSTDVFGNTLTSISAGYLGDPQAMGEYIRNVADWQQGIVLGYFQKSDRFSLHDIHIERGEAVYNGTLYRG